MRRRRWRTVVATTAALSIVMGSIALADVVENNAADSGGNSTIEVGGSTDIRYWIDAQPNDGGPPGAGNCNASSTNTITVAISTPADVVASPSSLSFTQCGNQSVRFQTVSFSSSVAGTYAISHAVSGGQGTTTNSADWTLTVNAAPPTNTAPQISISGVTDGDQYVKGSVPEAMCDVVDAEDGDSSFPATLSPVIGEFADDGIGSQTASCTYTDSGGLSASASATYTIIDATPPAIDYTLHPEEPDGNNQWYRGDVSLQWTITELESPNSLSTNGCGDVDVTDDQQATIYTCEAVSAGGMASRSVTIKRDATAPTITPGDVVDTTWRNTPLSQAFTASDSTSGLAEDTDSMFTLTASEESQGASQPTVVSRTVKDNAGNETTRSLSALIDLTNPYDVTFVGGPADGASYVFGSVPAAPTCTAEDALSGLDTCEVTGYSSQVGEHELTATATDKAGNIATATLAYEVEAWTLIGFKSPVRMGDDVINVMKGGRTVPLKFEIFAGETEITDTGAVTTFRVYSAACDFLSKDVEGNDITDTDTTTGKTEFRYDFIEGQFIHNWKTPKVNQDTCYQVVMTTADGSRIKADFRLTR
jgi:hypothetical protein